MRFADAMRNESSKLRNLNNFTYIDENRSDKGETSKKKNLKKKKNFYITIYSKRKIKTNIKIIRRQ